MQNCATALLSVSDKAGIVEFARELERASASPCCPPAAPPAPCAKRAWTVTDVSRGHRAPRNHGRTGEDPASAHSRGPARAVARQDAEVMAEHGIRPYRPAGGEPLPVRSDHRESRAAAAPRRSRTSTSAGRRCSGRRQKTMQHVAVVVDPQRLHDGILGRDPRRRQGRSRQSDETPAGAQGLFAHGLL